MGVTSCYGTMELTVSDRSPCCHILHVDIVQENNSALGILPLLDRSTRVHCSSEVDEILSCSDAGRLSCLAHEDDVGDLFSICCRILTDIVHVVVFGDGLHHVLTAVVCTYATAGNDILYLFELAEVGNESSLVTAWRSSDITDDHTVVTATADDALGIGVKKTYKTSDLSTCSTSHDGVTVVLTILKHCAEGHCRCNHTYACTGIAVDLVTVVLATLHVSELVDSCDDS